MQERFRDIMRRYFLTGEIDRETFIAEIDAAHAWAKGHAFALKRGT